MLEDLLAELQEKQALNPEAGTEAALDLNWADLKPGTQRLSSFDQHFCSSSHFFCFTSVSG